MLAESTPNNLYHSAPTEWADGSKADILYVPKTQVSNESPPILIEIQNRVDQRFMSRLIRYCTYVFDRYNTLPMVLVIAIKGFSIIEFEKEFSKHSNQNHLLHIQCGCWAKSCFFLSPKLIEDSLEQEPMDPLVGLAYVMMSQERNFESLPYKNDPIVKHLYATVQQFIAEKEDVDNKNTMMSELLETTESDLQSIIELEDGNQELIREKTKELLNKIKKNMGNSKENNNTTHNSDDFLYIETNAEPNKNKNSKSIFNEGKSKGLFVPYTSAESLKSAYYQTKKRLKNKK